MNFHFVETGKEQEDPPLADLLLHKVIYIYILYGNQEWAEDKV